MVRTKQTPRNPKVTPDKSKVEVVKGAARQQEKGAMQRRSPKRTATATAAMVSPVSPQGKAARTRQDEAAAEKKKEKRETGRLMLVMLPRAHKMRTRRPATPLGLPPLLPPPPPPSMAPLPRLNLPLPIHRSRLTSAVSISPLVQTLLLLAILPPR